MEFEIYSRHPNQKIDYLTRFYLSEKGSDTNLNERMTQLIDTKRYKDAPYFEKRSILYHDSAKIIARARKKALGEISETEPTETRKNYTTIDVKNWERTNQRDKDAANAFLKKELKRYGMDDFNNVDLDKNRVVRIKDRDINILVLGNQVVRKLRKGQLGSGK